MITLLILYLNISSSGTPQKLEMQELPTEELCRLVGERVMGRYTIKDYPQLKFAAYDCIPMEIK